MPNNYNDLVVGLSDRIQEHLDNSDFTESQKQTITDIARELFYCFDALNK